MPTWDLQQLRDNVERMHGKEQLELLSPSLNSVAARGYHAMFHYQEAERLLSDFLAKRSDQISLIKLVIGFDQNEKSAFEDLRLVLEAHLIACIQSMHARSDILSHVLYYGLGMNKKPNQRLATKDICAYQVQEKLKLLPENRTIADRFQKLRNHDDYRYLSDLVNHSKHRSIIGSIFTVDAQPTVDEYYRFELGAFRYEGRSHQKREIFGYLEAEYKRQGNLVIDLGNKLNEIVRAEKGGARAELRSHDRGGLPAPSGPHGAARGVPVRPENHARRGVEK